MDQDTKAIARPRIFDTPADLLDAVGSSLGPTAWISIDQDRINLFADATGDHQWIHVDPDRASRGAFGGTIAHGYLTLSLVNCFLPELIDVRGVAMGVNVGADRLRFPAPVRAGRKIRAIGEILSAEGIGSEIQTVVRVIVEIDGEAKPACVVETISRYFPEDQS